MSLRPIAKILGITPSYLNMMINGKRPRKPEIKERYEQLVNTLRNSVHNKISHTPHHVPMQAGEVVVSGVRFEPTTLGLKVRFKLSTWYFVMLICA